MFDADAEVQVGKGFLCILLSVVYIKNKVIGVPW